MHLCLVFPRYCPLRVRYNAGRVSPIQPVCILKLLSGDAVILRSEPSSRAALMGEQPNPWDLSLPPLLVGQDYTFTMAIRVTTNALGASRVIGVISTNECLSHRS